MKKFSLVYKSYKQKLHDILSAFVTCGAVFALVGAGGAVPAQTKKSGGDGGMGGGDKNKPGVGGSGTVVVRILEKITEEVKMFGKRRVVIQTSDWDYDISVPAGCGFWYIRRDVAGDCKISWRNKNKLVVHMRFIPSIAERLARSWTRRPRRVRREVAHRSPAVCQHPNHSIVRTGPKPVSLILSI